MFSELVELALPHVEALLHSGATTIEVKSGYGYSVTAELRMLEAIRELQGRTKARLVPTLLIHICPADAAERAAYLEEIRTQLLPEAARLGRASRAPRSVEPAN